MLQDRRGNITACRMCSVIAASVTVMYETSQTLKTDIFWNVHFLAYIPNIYFFGSDALE